MAVGILLAAGFSRRFGAEDKLMQLLPDGRPLALAAAQNLLVALPRTIAVVRPEAMLDGALIVAPAYRQQRGHPVAFAASLRGELENLRGDEGARSVLLRHRHEMHVLEVADAGVLADIDTPRDLPVA